MALVLEIIKLKKQKNGIRECTVVLDGRKLEPFLVYPEVYDLYPSDESFRGYIERQSRSLFELFGDEHGVRNAA